MNRKRQFTPAVFVVVFISAESCLKSYLQNVLLEVSALIIFLFCLAYFVNHFRTEQGTWDSFLEPTTPKRWEILTVILTILIGTLFRFWRLASLFDGMAWDEAYKGLDAIAIRYFGERPVFLDWNAGREAMIAYLVAASQQFLDFSVVSVRVVLTIAGVITLIFFYLLTRQLFTPTIALLSTFLLSFSKWHIIYSRYGVRVGLILVFETAVLYFIARGTQSKKKNPFAFILVGILGGLGFYTYIAYRIFPLIAGVFLLQKNVRSHLRTDSKAILGGLVVGALIVTPLLLFYWHNADTFTHRMERTAVWNLRGADKSAAALLADSTLKTFGIFTFEGDAIARHNVNGEPMLSPFASGFFVLGLLLLLVNLRKPLALFLLLYLFFTILPGILSVNAPHASRTLGSIVPAILLSSFGILAAWRIFFNISRILATLFLAVVLGGNFYTGTNDSLLRYSTALDSLHPYTSSLWGMDRDEFQVSQLLNQLGSGCDAYLSPQLFFHSTIEYLTYSKTDHKLYTFGTNPQLTNRNVSIIFLQPNEKNLWWLRDDEEKRFFKWWTQDRGISASRIHSILKRVYISYGRMTQTSDERLIQYAKKLFPGARVLKLSSFDVYIVRGTHSQLSK